MQKNLGEGKEKLRKDSPKQSRKQEKKQFWILSVVENRKCNTQ